MSFTVLQLIIYLNIYSQNIISYHSQNLSIKIPIVKNFIQVDSSIANNIKTINTFNIATFTIGDSSFDNHISLYGVEKYSNIKISKKDFQTFKSNLKKQFSDPNQILKSSNKNEIINKALSVLNDYYKDDNNKLKEIDSAFQLINLVQIDKIFTIDKPETLYNSDVGFINNYLIKLNYSDINYYSSLQISFALLNNFYIGISSSFDAVTKKDYDEILKKIKDFLDELIRLNPSK